ASAQMGRLFPFQKDFFLESTDCGMIVGTTPIVSSIRTLSRMKRMSHHLELRAKIDATNRTHSDTRELLYKAFEYDAVLAREDKLKAKYFETCCRVDNEVSGVQDMTFAENRVEHFREHFFSRFSGTKVKKLLCCAYELSYYSYPNEQPRVLLDIVAPAFFKIFPKGEIWFIEFNRLSRSEIWNGEKQLLKTHRLQSTGVDVNTYDPLADLESPHGMSGLEGGLSPYLWLRLMTCCFYPFVNGVISTPDARLFFL
ncbi:unnamed protein product, partial [marine sediment metagenome]